MKQPSYKYRTIKDGDEYVDVVSHDQFSNFNGNILALGKIAEEGKIVQALAVIFDLGHFTTFCNQNDP